MDDDREDAMDEMAIHYFARERSGSMSDEELLAMEAWLLEQPLHRQKYEELKLLWTELGELRSEPAVLELRETAMANARRHSRNRSLAFAFAAAISMAVMFGASWAAMRQFWPAEQVAVAPPHKYATSLGEIASFPLPDGSKAILDTNTEIMARIGAIGDRRVELLRGRAQFDVAHAEKRRFVVSAGTITIAALGTRFDVKKLPDRLEIDLVEGRLRIESRADFGEAGQASAAGSVEMGAGDKLVVTDWRWELVRGGAESLDWVNGQIFFDNAPIAEIVTELNRYTADKLDLKDPEVGQRRTSAVVRVSDPAAFLRAIEQLGLARITRTDKGFEIDTPK